MNRRDRRRAARALGLTKAQRQALDRAAGLGRVTRVEVEGDRPASAELVDVTGRPAVFAGRLPGLPGGEPYVPRVRVETLLVAQRLDTEAVLRGLTLGDEARRKAAEVLRLPYAGPRRRWSADVEGLTS